MIIVEIRIKSSMKWDLQEKWIEKTAFSEVAAKKN